MSLSRSHSFSSDVESIDFDDLDLDDLKLNDPISPPAPQRRLAPDSGPSVRLTVNPPSTSRQTSKIKQVEEQTFKKNELPIDEEDLDALLQEDIEISDDEEIPTIQEKKPLAKSGFRVSRSRGTGSPQAEVKILFPYRDTSRYTMKQEPDPYDIWDVAGKYLRTVDLDTILSEATNAEAVEKFNRRHGISLPPARSEFAIKKSSVDRTLPKKIRLARILLSPISRLMALETLMKTKKTDKSAYVLEPTFDLSDENYFIQFTPDGDTFPMNHPDNREMQEAAGLVSGNPEGNYPPDVFELVVPDLIPPNLIKLLRMSIAYDPEETSRIDYERVKIVKSIVHKLAEMEIAQLEEADALLDKLDKE